MREIKFRAWGYGKMEYGVDVVDGKPYTNAPGYFEVFEDRKIIDGILMQYTGLKDKNGKEIWESDLVWLDGHPYSVEWMSDGWWLKEQFGVDRFPYAPCGDAGYEYCDEDIRWKTAEVIGNIHENPELLND